MKPSLIQRQLHVNSRIIHGLECQIKDDKSKIYTVGELVKVFNNTGNSKTKWYKEVVSELDETRRILRAREHNLKGLRELQKSLKKDLKFYHSQCREVSLCRKMLAKVDNLAHIRYYEERLDVACAKLAVYIDD